MASIDTAWPLPVMNGRHGTCSKTVWRNGCSLPIMGYDSPTPISNACCAIVISMIIDAQKQLLFKYGGQALPFIVLIDGRGKVRRVFTGLFGAGTLAEALAQIGGTDSAPST